MSIQAYIYLSRGKLATPRVIGSGRGNANRSIAGFGSASCVGWRVGCDLREAEGGWGRKMRDKKMREEKMVGRDGDGNRGGRRGTCADIDSDHARTVGVVFSTSFSNLAQSRFRPGNFYSHDSVENAMAIRSGTNAQQKTGKSASWWRRASR